MLGMAEKIADDYGEREYGQTRVLSDTIESEHTQNQYIRLEDDELVTVKAHGGEKVVRADELRYMQYRKP